MKSHRVDETGESESCSRLRESASSRNHYINAADDTPVTRIKEVIPLPAGSVVRRNRRIRITRTAVRVQTQNISCRAAK